jgi:hypothetical protein
MWARELCNITAQRKFETTLALYSSTHKRKHISCGLTADNLNKRNKLLATQEFTAYPLPLLLSQTKGSRHITFAISVLDLTLSGPQAVLECRVGSCSMVHPGAIIF